MNDIKSKTFVGMVWSFIATWGGEVLTFLVLITLARLLSPDQFGIVALAAAFVFVCREIINWSISRTLVQLKDAEPEHFDSAFWVTLTITTGCAIGLLLCAKPIGRLFESDLLADLIPWMAPILILSGVEIVQESWIMRELKFKALAKRALIAITLGGATAIALAIAGYGLWSLVAQHLVISLVNTVLIWWFCDWRPRFRISSRHLRQIFHFGKYMSGTSVCYMLGSRAYIFIIGLFLGPAAVGLYNVGQRIRRMLINAIPGAMARVYLPSMSRMIEQDPAAFPGAFSDALRFSAILSLPVFAGLACTAEEVVLVMLGEKWIDGIPVLRFLALAGFLQAGLTVSITAVIALGRADLEFKTAVVGTIVRVGLILIAVHWGIVAVAAAEALSVLLVEGVYIWFVIRCSSVTLRQYLQALAPVFAATATMAVSVLAAKALLQGLLSPFATLPILVGLGAFAYLVALYLFSPKTTVALFVATTDLLRRRHSAEQKAA